MFHDLLSGTFWREDEKVKNVQGDVNLNFVLKMNANKSSS